MNWHVHEAYERNKRSAQLLNILCIAKGENVKVGPKRYGESTQRG
jgi:hypothetical protein